MKRYIFSLLAIVMAAGIFSFTRTHSTSPTTTSTFYYVAPGGTDFSANAVQNVNNWKTAPSPLPSCNTGTNKACRFTIDDMYTSGTGAAKIITIALNAEPGNGGIPNGFVIRTGLNPHISSPAERP